MALEKHFIVVVSYQNGIVILPNFEILDISLSSNIMEILKISFLLIPSPPNLQLCEISMDVIWLQINWILYLVHGRKISILFWRPWADNRILMKSESNHIYNNQSTESQNFNNIQIVYHLEHVFRKCNPVLRREISQKKIVQISIGLQLNCKYADALGFSNCNIY